MKFPGRQFHRQNLNKSRLIAAFLAKIFLQWKLKLSGSPQQVFVDEYEDEDGNHIHLTDPQSEIFLSKYKFPLFVAGYGSGKSLCMATCALNDLFNYPGANVAVYAPTYDLLSLIIMAYIEEALVNGEFYYRLNKQNHIFDVEGYGNIICRSLDNPGRIIGYETFRAHVDELDTLEEKKALRAWQKIIARNRQKVYRRNEKTGKRIPIIAANGEFVFKNGRQLFETHMNRVSAYTTPEGWMFCYDRWEKQKDPKKHYKIYRASTYSNEHNLPDDYIDTLIASYPAELIDAYIHGEFVNLTQGRVYRKFDRKLNSSTETVGSTGDPREELHIGMDFNIEKGAASIHVKRDCPDETQEYCLHCVDQVHDSYDTDDTIRIIDEKYPDNEIHVYPDATGKKRASSNGAPTKTDLAKIKDAGYVVHVTHSNPLIKDRVNNVNAQILNGRLERHYFVNEDTCPDVVETLEKQVWDDNGVPDKSNDLDHQGDGVGYIITKLFPIVRQGAAFVKQVRRE